MYKLGKLVVLVNFSGSVMVLNWEQDNVDVIVQVFYLGEVIGIVLVWVLWGEVSLLGCLFVIFYCNLEGFVKFDDYDMMNCIYWYFEGEVLYLFGYGLSYIDMQYSVLQVLLLLMVGDDLLLLVILKNVGNYDVE